MTKQASHVSTADVAGRGRFRKLERRLQIGLSTAFFVPVVIMSGYFHFQFHTTMTATGKQRLIAVAESQRNTIDLFLQERVANMVTLFQNSIFKLDPTEYDMMALYQNLRQSDAPTTGGSLCQSPLDSPY